MALSGIGAAHCATIHGGASSVHGALAGGLGLALGIYAAAGVSGGHLNPAVTAAFMFLGRMGNGPVLEIVFRIRWKNRNFGQKSKFWSKIEILVKNRNFGQKSNF